MNCRDDRISSALSHEINSHRARLAPFFNGNAKPNPSVSFANDGTGFGKSYNVFDQFVENSAVRNESGATATYSSSPRIKHRSTFPRSPRKGRQRGCQHSELPGRAGLV